MERLQIIIGKFTLISLIICMILVSSGGVYYLIGHGNQRVDWHHFRQQPAQAISFSNIAYDTTHVSATGIIELGLFTLLLIQVLRIALIAWLFIKLKDKIFSFISLFILFILLYFSIWHF